MPGWRTFTVVLAGFALLWAACVAVLIVTGRRGDARAVAGFVPDCVILMGRLVRDPRLPRRRKVLVALAFAYLALPIDLIPDFIPVAGQLDDAIVVVLVLRVVVRGAGRALLEEHWPGPEETLRLVRRAAFGRSVNEH